MEHLKHHLRHRQNEMKLQLRTTSERRHFLLRQKAKYAGQYEFSMLYIDLQLSCILCLDGQKIAKKLSKQITGSIRVTISKYNQLCLQTGMNELSICDVLNVNSHIWSCSGNSESESPHIPMDVTHDVSQAYFELNRSDEELALLKSEMMSFSCYYKSKTTVIDSTISALRNKEQSMLQQGSIAFLIKLRWSMELLLNSAENCFDVYLNPKEHNSAVKELSSDSSSADNLSELNYSD